MHEVDLRPGREPAGVLGPHLGERQRASHLAGHLAQQDRRLLGSPVDLPEVHGDDPGPHGSGPGDARGDRRSVAGAAARETDHLVVAPHEPAAAGRRLRRHVLRRGQPRTDSEPDTQSHSRRRAMRERLRRERRYSWPELSLAGLGREPRRLVPMARIRRLRHRRAQPEGRLPGHVPIERSVVVHERSESDLPLQQRRAEPAHPIDLAVDQPLTCRIPRVLRPGTVDVPPPHVAGGAPVRQGHQLVPGTTGRTVADSCRRRSTFPRRKASTATRTSRLGWAWRTTCSETARPRSSSTSASTSRASPCSSFTSTRIPCCGCPARRVCSRRRA